MDLGSAVHTIRPDADKLGDGSRRHKQLVESVYSRHPMTGEVMGVGLKYFPDGARPEPPADNRLFNPRD